MILSVDLSIYSLLLFINSLRASLSPLNERCMCPLFVKLSTLDLNPPLSNQNLAAFDNAATTELSSVTSGIV